jgi:hypothetical protein
MHRIAGGVAAALIVTGSAAAARGEDEIDALLDRVRPPARFQDYRPQFGVRNVRFRWTAFRKKEDRAVALSEEKRAIFDGDRLIGYLVEKNPLWGHIRLFSLHPRHEAKIDPGDWADATEFRNYARDYGDELCLAIGATFDETRTDVAGGGETITFVRTDVWKPAVSGRDGRAVHTAVLKVHPQLGYVVEHALEFQAAKLPQDARTQAPIARLTGGDLWGWGVVNPWPGEGTYTQGFFSHGASYRKGRDGSAWAPDKTFSLFWMNGPTVENIRHGFHPQVRPGGLVGYLGGREGWGVCLTVVGSPDVHAAVCPAWGEFHLGGPDVPAQPDARGLRRVAYRRRLAGLPPEIQDHIRANAKVLFEDRKGLAIRLDGEDFEDQPRPFATPLRTLRFEGRGVSVTEERARSGKRSIVTKGIKPEDLPKVNLHEEHPPVCFDPNRRYRLACWIYVEGEGTEAFVIAANELEVKDATMFLREETVGKSRTPSVKAAGEWRKATLEFTAPPYGGVLALGFVAIGPGKAYFDDFRLDKESKN